MKKSTTLVLAAAATLAAGPAFAHTGHGETSGLLAGFTHPLLGVDHLLAMVSVGIWSALAMPKSPLAAPAAFVAAMVAGAGLSFAGAGLPAVEGMIAVSVLALGLMIVAGARLPSALGVGLVALFALFHGHAHASEASGAAVAYVAGFSAATAALHLAGVGFGRAFGGRLAARMTTGIAVAGAGAALFAGL